MYEITQNWNLDQLLITAEGNETETLTFHGLRLELTVFDNLTFFGKSILVGSLSASFVVGSYFKSALHFYMYDGGTDIIYNPIDLLILVQALIEHSIATIMTTFYVVGVAFNITFAHYFGENWCNIPFHASTMGVANRICGSVAIAILRMFYVKFPYKVKDDLFKKRMTIGILTTGIVSIILSGIGFGVGNGPASRKQVLWNFCVGQSEKFREVAHNYALAIGTIKPISDTIPATLTILSLGWIFVELLCYIVLFKHLYSHNEELLRKKTLPVGEIKQRHMQNATSFVGQFYGFVVKTVLTSGVMFTMMTESEVTFIRMVIVVFVWVEFGIISIVEVMTSQNLRKNLPHNRYHN